MPSPVTEELGRSELDGLSTDRIAPTGAALDGPTTGATSVADYLELTKPRITMLNMITTFAAIWIATAGQPAWSLVVPALAGTALSVGSGAVLNCWAERDRDSLMARTRNRALPAGRVPPLNALMFGIILGIAGVGLLQLTTTTAAALIALTGIVYYAGIYTVILKGRTHWNTVLGSVSGAVPPLIGWAAATGGVDVKGLAVAGLVFIWQPVHFWSLAMLYAEDYRRAGIKMLPVTHGFTVTRWHILRWSIYMVVASVALYFLDLAGLIYLTAAVGLGTAMIMQAIRNLRDSGLREAGTLFHISNLYLALMYVLMIVDCGCGS